ncbi:hypothetical protein HYN56_02370 [Flavobacterium crocinum]|uniref:DUF304 domain-containing protein n=1 Tax=Flavobacterium crocinum TaxID=2183896 RepID=A0A2S1YGE3_9FLAO|nr:hypothetical protein [Flavobacterium crocinum]AWK03124.1 hypothetical protein HYN56_02370 [Flavobacterium crocinum]
MIENVTIPDILKEAVGAEKIVFLIKAKKDQPIRNCLHVIGFGLFWILVISLIFSAFDWDFFSGDYTISVKEIPDLLYFSLFLFPGIICFLLGVFGLFKSGGYFIGTENKLVCYRWGKMQTYPWEEFTNEIEVFGNKNHGNIIFKLKTGVYITRNHRKVLSNTKINIGDILYAFEIVNYCRTMINQKQ